MGWFKTGSRGSNSFPYRRVLVVLAPAILLLLMAAACDSVPSAPEIPHVPLPTIPRADLPATTTPSPSTPGAALPTTAPDTITTATSAPPDTGLVNVMRLPRLNVVPVRDDIPKYSRDDWKHWNDTDKDCQNTRAEVLIEESTAAPTFASDRRCRVTGGIWNGPYSGQTFTDAGDLDIDHLVPLKNAHRSGGWQWNQERKEDYANSMASDFHLIAVDKSANRAKGAKGPEAWQPPDSTYHCRYAQHWIKVKHAWDLTATEAEWQALEEMLTTCPVAVESGEAGGIVAPAPTSTPPPAPPPTRAVFTGSLFITEIMPDPSAVRDAAGEWFEVHNPDRDQEVNLMGWTIRKDEGKGHRISAELPISPGGYLVLGRNSDKAVNGGIVADYEYAGFTLTNDGDVIELVEPAGRVADRVEYGEGQVFAGKSISLDAGSLSADANDIAANWCRAATQMPNGDFGTPGELNDACR